MTHTLLTVECGSIQSYIFSSNRLLENVGASYLVAQATEGWILEALSEAKLSHNMIDPKAANPFADGHLFEDRTDWQAEVIYIGGGNAVILFRDEGGARAFTEQLSKKALLKAPNLRLQVHSLSWDKAHMPLGKAVGKLRKTMKAAVSRQPASPPLLGLGVTAVCQETGLPAAELVRVGDDRRYVSAEILAKRNAAEEAKRELRKLLSEDRRDSHEFPDDLDDLGRSEGARSYIAIVHADGNSIGEIISEIGEETDSKRYVERIRAFSQAVKHISLKAMQAVVDLLVQKSIESTAIQGTSATGNLEFRPDDNQRTLLPIR
ncbi:MAG: hypothetical protein RML95_14460, partial [Anaerolineae bacterium]|nr:hypothetical protein [Anaerolineae bacterium]